MEEEKFISFRVPIELAEQAKKRAKSQHRSLQGHMLHLIENDLAEHPQKNSSKPSKVYDDDDDKIVRPEVLYPDGLPPEMRMAFEAEMHRIAAATKTEAKSGSKKRPQSASKKLPKKTA
jgi:hypothetical protein